MFILSYLLNLFTEFLHCQLHEPSHKFQTHIEVRQTCPGSGNLKVLAHKDVIIFCPIDDLREVPFGFVKAICLFISGEMELKPLPEGFDEELCGMTDGWTSHSWRQDNVF